MLYKSLSTVFNLLVEENWSVKLKKLGAPMLMVGTGDKKKFQPREMIFQVTQRPGFLAFKNIPYFNSMT